MSYKIPLSTYASSKNKYCISYLGPCINIVERLKNIRPNIESKLPGLEVYLSFRDNLLYLVEKEERIIPESKLKHFKKSMGFVRELKNDMVNDPIDLLMKEL